MNLGWTWPIWPIGLAHRLTSPGSTTHPALPSPHSRTRRTLTLIVPLALATASRRRRCRTIPANLGVGCRRHEGQSVCRPGLHHLTEGNPLPRPRSPAASLLLLWAGRRSVSVPPFTAGTRLASPSRASPRAPLLTCPIFSLPRPRRLGSPACSSAPVPPAVVPSLTTSSA
jgi:hypothetical protein